ncbi:MAG TPA: TIM-barrel domain-containing protein [Rhodothermales bacterium]
MTRTPIRPLTLSILLLVLAIPARAQVDVIGDLPDVSLEFRKLEQTYFVGSAVTEFDAATGRGLLQWNRYERHPNLSFNKLDVAFMRAESSEFPGTEYDRDPALPFEISFVSPRTVRLRFSTRDVPIEGLHDEPSPMLAGPVPTDDSWSVSETADAIEYTSEYGRVRLLRDPWHIEFYDAENHLLTRTQTLGDPASFMPYVPFSFIRRARDLGRSTAATFELSHDEKIYGAGESFTRLDKRGQKIVAYLRDAMGAQNYHQYKAVPFFMSSNGYGMFVHTSTPVTFDFGHDFDAHNTIYTGDELFDIFVFLGEPKDILSEYTAVSGRSPVPPLWSFGLWMSRITYDSEAQVREVARLLRQHRIPTDVIHIDTGWFETDWRNDYRFSESRFDDPAAMIRDLREMGFHISLWQLPYFSRKNALWDEIVEHGYHVKNEGGLLPYEDAIVDFSNPDAVAWYKDKLRGLLELGVSVIKADFGEDAPLFGLYHSGRTGWYEHNLYPVRYNDAVYDVTQEVTGGGIIWGRSAWAGSQRYPLHWGGDAENTNSAMAATLRAGLSMGLSGFTYWSHDIGGFVNRAPRDLYRRWTPFGALSSHTRTHGAPPREPWEYDEELTEDFRRAMNLRYSLIPYLYAQSVDASSKGHPMMRALFIEYPDDPTSWLVEDEYLLGSDLLVAPLFSESNSRRVYLPPGQWYDYQTGTAYDGAAWHEIEAGEIPVILLARAGAAIPHAAVAQSTSEIDWDSIELRVYGSGQASGLFALPEGEVARLTVSGSRVSGGAEGVRFTVRRVR